MKIHSAQRIQINYTANKNAHILLMSLPIHFIKIGTLQSMTTITPSTYAQRYYNFSCDEVSKGFRNLLFHRTDQAMASVAEKAETVYADVRQIMKEHREKIEQNAFFDQGGQCSNCRNRKIVLPIGEKEEWTQILRESALLRNVLRPFLIETKTPETVAQQLSNALVRYIRPLLIESIFHLNPEGWQLLRKVIDSNRLDFIEIMRTSQDLINTPPSDDQQASQFGEKADWQRLISTTFSMKTSLRIFEQEL